VTRRAAPGGAPTLRVPPGTRAHRRCRPAARDRGSATLLVLWTAVVVAVVAVAVATGASVLRGAARARAAADLAALAAADVLGLRDDPCAVAATVAVRNGARLVSCRAGAGDVTVVAEVRGAGRFVRAVRASARAEPGVARPPPG